MPQYSADIVAILAIVAAFLPSLIASPVMLFSVRLHESVALPIHRRAELLLKVAALKCAPIENLARVRTDCFSLIGELTEENRISQRKLKPVVQGL